MKALYFEDDISVCTYDIDFAGHVSNIVYLRWLEEMRLKMFNKYCPFKEYVDRGVTPVLVSTEIHYKGSVRLFDKPRCKIWISQIANATLTIDAEIYLEEKLTTTARFKGVFVDISSMRPIRLPKDFLRVVQESDLEANSPVL